MTKELYYIPGLEKISDSMQLDSDNAPIAILEKNINDFDCTIEIYVFGKVNVNCKGDWFFHAQDMPEELIAFFGHKDCPLKQEDVIVNSNNWFEAFVSIRDAKSGKGLFEDWILDAIIDTDFSNLDEPGDSFEEKLENYLTQCLLEIIDSEIGDEKKKEIRLLEKFSEVKDVIPIEEMATESNGEQSLLGDILDWCRDRFGAPKDFALAYMLIGYWYSKRGNQKKATKVYQPTDKDGELPNGLFSFQAFLSKEKCLTWLKKHDFDINDFSIDEYSIEDIEEITILDK